MRFARLLSTSLVFSLLGGMVAVLPPLPAAAVDPLVADRSVPVSAVKGKTVPVPSWPDAVPGPAVLPGGGSAEVAVAAPVVAVGGLPVDVVAAEPSEVQSLGAGDVPLAQVKVTVAAPSVSQLLGVKGVVLAVSRTDGVVGEGRAELVVDYRSWAGLFGAGFGDRLRLVELPACALTSPSVRSCQHQVAVASSNSGGVVAGEVTVPAASAAVPFAVPSGVGAGPSAVSASVNDAVQAAEDAGSGAAVFAVTSGASGAGGDFKQTSLSPAGSWNAGSGSGSFTWSYPLGVPAGLGGPAPSLSLSYNSGSVDGRTHFTNGQAPWTGEGWSEDLGGGFIERSYKGCNDDGSPTGDMCWYSVDNATISFQGQSTSLVKDLQKGWRTASETGWRVEKLNDTWNGDNDAEYWKITTLDGTQYFFGKHVRFTGDTIGTNSAQVMPVYGNHSWEPCYSSSGFASSWCMQAYRWNLDYVIDPRGNTMSYFYTEWSNNYGANNNTVGLSYDAASRLDRIEYGTRTDSGMASAPFLVRMVSANRCVASCTAPEYLDTPMDLKCESISNCANNTSPTFWQPYRLSEVVVFALNTAGAHKAVDKWTLEHVYRQGTNSAANLFLKSITHTGYDAAENGQAENPVLFGEHPLANRIETTGSPNIHFRVQNIHNGTGGVTRAFYSGVDCPQYVAGFNPHRCYPQYTSAAKDDPSQWSWFNKYVVTKIEQIDETGGSLTETWNYKYSNASSPDTSLWTHDEAEASTKRGWTIWKGYSDVTVTHGSPAGNEATDLKTSAVFHRGLDGDAGNDGWGTPLWRNRKAQLASLVGTSNLETGAIGGYSADLGLCLTTAAGGIANGTQVQAGACESASQTWRYDHSTRRLFHKSGRCLDIAGGSAQHGAAVQIFDCNTSTAQEWRWQTDGRLLNPYSGKCLGTTSHGVAAGTAVKLYNCSSSYDQRWMPQADQTLRLNTATRCIDVRSGGTADGTAIQSYDCNQTDPQRWQYDVTTQTLKNPASVKCVTISGTLIQLAGCAAPTAAQKWVPQADGTLKNAAANKCIDATNTPAPGTQLTAATCTGSHSQRFAHLITDHAALAGQTRQTSTMNGSQVIGSGINSYTVTNSGERGAPPGTNTTAIYAWLTQATRAQTKTLVTATATPSWRWTDTQTVFDTQAPTLPAVVKDFGDIATADDNVCTTTSYNTAMAYPAFMVSYPKEILTVAYPQETPASACGVGGLTEPLILSGQHFHYDNANDDTAPTRGLVTKAKALKQVSGGTKTWTETRTEYDGNGRATKTYDPLNRWATTAYTQTPAGGPVRSVKTTNMLGHESTVAMNHRGQPLSITDPNLKTTTATYDRLGRLLTVKKPSNNTTTPDAEYAYATPASPAASYTSAKALGPNGNQIVSYQTYDGWLRPRQAQTPAPDGKRVISDTAFDNRGLTIQTAVFYNSESGPASGLVTVPLASAGQLTRNTFDGAGRQIKSQLMSANVEKAVTTTAYKGDRVEVTPPAGGTKTTTFSNARGKTTALWQHDNSGGHTATTYTYDRLGQLTKVADPAGNQWLYEYDLLGRKTKSTDPDAGISTTSFDNAGQVLSTTDGRGQQLWFEYDLLGRKTKTRADTTTGTVLSSWVYDTVAKGQLTSTTRHDPSGNYISEVVSYNNAYQPVKTQVTAPGFGAVGGTLTYTTTNEYKPNGAPFTSEVPAAGNIVGEKLEYSYNNTGQLTRLRDLTAGTIYLASASYAYDGKTAQQHLGAAGKQIRVSHNYDAATRALNDITTETETAGTFAAKHAAHYSYDPAGNITSAATFTNGVADQAECFKYDHLRRLTQAWTQSPAVTGCNTPQKTGADPYWRTWAIDAIGNRTSQTDHITATTAAMTWSHANGATHGVKPHQVKTVTAAPQTGPAVVRTFGYDAAGNMTSRTTENGVTTQTLEWDKENHLAKVKEGTTTVASYQYNTDGSRLLGVSTAGTETKTTLYLPDGTELEKSSSGGQIQATRYIAGIAVRDTTGLKWTVSNHQGTPIAQIDATTLAVTARRMMPYGEPRGTQPTWMGSKGYVGGTKDTPTGLTHLGAREYDPTIGRFISVDPLMDLADPQQWNPYTYSNNNPTTFADPSGLMRDGQADTSGCSANDTGCQFAYGDGGIKFVWETIQERGCRDWSHCAENIQKEKPFDKQSPMAQSLIIFQTICAVDPAGCQVLKDMRKKAGEAALYELVGLGDAERCFGEGSVSGCAWTAVNIAGLFASFLKFRSLLRASKAGGAGIGLKGGHNFGGACLNSFDPETEVQLADGSTKKIKDIREGDLVLATDPETGETAGKSVTALHLNLDSFLTDLIVATPDGVHATIKTTWEHPFWVASRQAWINASQLTPGDTLHTTDGTTVTVNSVDNYNGNKWMHNLTVADIHTYYVLAGNTPVLVHNCPDDIPTVTSRFGTDAAAARGLKLQPNNPAVINRTMTVRDYVANYRKASVARELGEEYMNMTVEKALMSGDSTVRKLLIDGRFAK